MISDMDNHFAFNEAIRQKLDHEHSVISNRTGWHDAIQIAMFTGFYEIIKSNFTLYYIKYVLLIMGILYALSAIYSLWVSEKARACIFMHWNRYRTKNDLDWKDFPPASGNPLPLIKKCKDDLTIRMGMELKYRDIFFAKHVPHWFMLYSFIPIVFIILWAVCLIVFFLMI